MESKLPPRSKKAETKRKRIRTVEGSCWQCKQGRVKCSLEKPACKRCCKTNQVCDYNKVRLKWTTDNRVGGLYAPPVGANSRHHEFTAHRYPSPANQTNVTHNQRRDEEKTETKLQVDKLVNSATEGSWININSSSNSDCDNVHNTHSDVGTEVVSGYISDSIASVEDEVYSTNWEYGQIVRPSSISSLDPLLSFEKFAMQPSSIMSYNQQLAYFKNVFLPKFHVFGNDINLDWSEVLNDPLTNQLVVTLSTYDMFHDASSSVYIEPEEATKERSLALKCFSKSLREGDSSSLESMFKSSIMLCILDGMIEPQIDSKLVRSTNHLFGARALMSRLTNSNSTTSPSNSNPLYSRMLSIFVTMDLTYSFLALEKPFFPSTYWMKFSGADCWFGNLGSNDSLLRVLSLLSELAELGAHYKTTKGGLTTESLFQANNIHLQLTEYDVEDPSSCTLWDRYVSAFAQVGLIYYHRVLINRSMESLFVQNIAYKFVANISLPMSGVLEHCLLFPLLVVGAHVQNFDHQLILKERMINTYNYLKFESVRLSLIALEKIWSTNNERKHTLSWKDLFENISRTSFVF